MAVSVYLDSSDYSTLSNPGLISSELAEIRERLLDWASSGAVEYWYSAVHITEMAPLESRYASAATTRTDLLVSLCGKNALFSLERLLALELQAVDDDTGPPAAVHSRTGDWFPDLSGLIAPLEPLNEAKVLDEVLPQGLGRSERRKLEKTFRKKVRRAGGIQQAAAQARTALNLEEITETYPMTLEAASVLRDFVVGKATRLQAEDAFLACLRNPRWMMQWFEKHSDKLSPLHEWVRKPARELRERMALSAGDMSKALAQQAELRKSALALGLDSSLFPAKTRAEFRAERDPQIPATAAQLATRLFGIPDPELTLPTVSRNAPGLTTSLRVMYDVVWDSVGPNPRKMKNSDFVDCVHSMYAPYVNIFRADAYMGPLVAEATAPYGTSIVSRLPDLIPAIEAQLEKQPTS